MAGEKYGPTASGEKFGPTASGLEAALIALGSTPDAVATTLANGGYRGERHQCSACPIAAYLADVTGHEAEVMIGHAALLVGRTASGDLRWVDVKPPLAVEEFVEAFDNGMWPELAVES